MSESAEVVVDGLEAETLSWYVAIGKELVHFPSLRFSTCFRKSFIREGRDEISKQKF